MNTSLNSPSVQDSSERRLVLLWLLFLFTVILVSPPVFAAPDGDEDSAPMSCGSTDCQPQSCAAPPEVSELDVFIAPSENSTSARSSALLPVALAVLYLSPEPPSLSVPVRSAPDTSLVFVPLHVMGPAHAAHAPPFA